LNTDIIFGAIIFVGVIWLIVNTIHLSGDKNDDEFRSKQQDLPLDKSQEKQ
jgi:hypothetical protein